MCLVLICAMAIYNQINQITVSLFSINIHNFGNDCVHSFDSY